MSVISSTPEHRTAARMLATMPTLRDLSPTARSAFQTLVSQLQAAWQAGDTVVTINAEIGAQLAQLSLPLLAAAASSEASSAALVSDGNRLWLGRAYATELAISAALADRMQQPFTPEGLGGDLDAAFAELAGMSWPLRAHLHCMTGGPGSGKSTRIAAWLAGLSASARPGVVRLLAPTGKAAQRLADVLRRERETVYGRMQAHLDASAAARLAENLAATPTTVHSALLVRQPALYWYSTSAVIVDEASMLDAQILAQLLAAIPPEVPLLLVGDPAQLPSVGVGAVLRDCQQILRGYADGRLLTHLGAPARFDPAGPIATLAHAIQAHGTQCQPDCVLRHTGERGPGAERVQVLEWRDESALHTHLAQWLESHAEIWHQYWQGNADERLAILGRMRVLAAVREGQASVRRLATLMRRWFVAQGMVPARNEPLYAGLPILVTRNSYELGLANGDMGVVFERQGQYFAYFSEDLQVLVDRLPAYEPAWVSTIHKAQGSEFQHVCVVLPAQDSHGLLSRELLYTAVTRVRSAGMAQASLRLLVPPGSLCRVAGLPGERETGLVSLLQSSVQW